MNCRPNDIAFVIKAHPNWQFLIGKIVKVSRLAVGRDAWITDPVHIDEEDGAIVVYDDDCLRPIRPGDLDEILDTDIKKSDEVAA
jgi:hypothetical protein